MIDRIRTAGFAVVLLALLVTSFSARADKYDDALESYDKAIELDPGNAAVQLL